MSACPMYAFLPFSSLFPSMGLCPIPFFCGCRSDKFARCQKLAPKHTYSHSSRTKELLSASNLVQRSYSPRYSFYQHHLSLTLLTEARSWPSPSSSSKELGFAWLTPLTSSPGKSHSFRQWHPFSSDRNKESQRELSLNPWERSRSGALSWLMLWWVIPLKNF